MNVPEALKATQHALMTFRKAVTVAGEEMESEMHRIHSQLLEEQPKVAEMSEVRRLRD